MLLEDYRKSVKGFRVGEFRLIPKIKLAWLQFQHEVKVCKSVFYLIIRSVGVPWFRVFFSINY